MECQRDWQNDCPDMKSRGKKIFESEQWCDCRFLVGSEPNQEFFSGHKLLLAMASPVFERMFFGNLPDKTDPILIPDVAPEAFRGMMEYIYTDKIKIDSFEKACELCYVAKKYILPHVVKQCTSYLFQDLNPTNVCRAFEFAKLFEEPTLKNRCLQIISRRTKEVIADETFMDIELPTLLAIFSLDQLNIESELDLFKALNDYAIKHGYVSVTKKNEENTSQPTVSLDVVAMEPHIDVEDMQENANANMNDNDVEIIPSDDSPAGSVGAPTPSPGLISIPSVSNEPASPAVVVNDNIQQNINSGEGSSKNIQEQEAFMAGDSQEIRPKRSISELKDAIRKIRFLTLTPQQFAEIPAKSELLTESQALAIFIIISNPLNTYPMPEGFCTSRIRRNFFGMRNEERIFHEIDPYFTAPAQGGRQECIMALHLYNNFDYEPEVVNPMTETRKFYCIRTIRQQIDYRNTSVTDCVMTFHVDTNILITGCQVPTQVLMDSNGFSQRYSECLYAHLLDAQGSRLAYTHLTSRVCYDSLVEISFDRPVFIHRNKMYKIGIVFNKVGWYPMYTCYPEVTCDNVHFMFNIGAPHESLRDGLIRAIVFTHPVSPSTPSNLQNSSMQI